MTALRFSHHRHSGPACPPRRACADRRSEVLCRIERFSLDESLFVLLPSLRVLCVSAFRFLLFPESAACPDPVGVFAALAVLILFL
jgi:hypothetical protein